VNKPPYPLSSMAMILFGLSHLEDCGNGDDITLEDIKKHARAGDLIEFLTEKSGGMFASGFLEGPNKEFADWYVAQIRENCNAMDGREQRKYGIKNRGICLLISYTAEIIQQEKDLTFGLVDLDPPIVAPGSPRLS
jgi:hypothetical protein